MSIWINDYRSLVDFFSVVLGGSPDNFYKEDFLSDDEQLNLTRAFAELKQGMRFADERIADKQLVARIHEGLDASLAAYRGGQIVQGARTLQEVERTIVRNARQSRFSRNTEE